MIEIRERLALRERRAAAAEGCVPAAVLIPLFVRDGELSLLFTRRNDRVEHHKGQISFPGGVRELADTDLIATALRESQEEIGLAPADAVVLGALDDLATITKFMVTPIVAAIPYPYPFEVSRDEIDELIIAPYVALKDPRIYEERVLQRGEAMAVVKFFHYERHMIWGITAQILSQLMEVV